MERSEVHEALGKAEAQVISLEEDKKKLLEEVKNVRKLNFYRKKIIVYRIHEGRTNSFHTFTVECL